MLDAFGRSDNAARSGVSLFERSRELGEVAVVARPPGIGGTALGSAQGARRPIPIRLEYMAEERQSCGENCDFRGVAERFGSAHREHVGMSPEGPLPCCQFAAAAGTHVQAAGV